jgi:hypothetical protein
MKRIDFTNCPIVPGRAYNGANGKKISIEFEGSRATADKLSAVENDCSIIVQTGG